MRVMVVEDDPDLVRLFPDVLRLAGHEVLITSDNFEDLLTHKPWEGVDGALVDQALGSAVTGTDILAWVMENEPHITRVMLTAQPVGVEARLVAKVLRKPVDMADVIAALEHG